MPDEPLSMINLAVPFSLKTRLRDYARRQDLSMKEVVVMALLNYLEEHDPQEMKPRGK